VVTGSTARPLSDPFFNILPDWSKFKGLLLAATARKLGGSPDEADVMAAAESYWQLLVNSLAQRLPMEAAERAAVVKGTLSLAIDSQLIEREWTFDPRWGWKPPSRG
jgi:hypothetical protein